jgi:outer membrane protein assembly factor BamB
MRTLVVALALLFTTQSFAEDWTHWRGPTQNGVSNDKNLPDDWNPKGKNVIWSAPVGSRSAPVVSRGKVYLIGSVNPDQVTEQERVTCLDAETGKTVWEHRFNVFLTDIVTNRVGWAVPCADPETGNVYTHGTQGLLTCFSEDGKIVWQHSLTEEYGRVSGYGGRTSSPIVIDDLVIIHMVQSSWGDNGRGGFRFAAFDKKTGENRWWSKTDVPPLDTTYSVPIALDVNGMKLVIAGGGDQAIHALKANTGEHVWKMIFTAARGINVSPVADYQKGWVYFCQSEENVGTNVQGCVMCVDAGKVEKDGTPKIIWKKLGILSGFGSPVLHEGRLYVVDNTAKMFCLDAATGNEIWTHKYGRNTKGSPVLADGKFYVGEVSSTWHVFRPLKDKAEKISSTRIPAGPGGTLVEVNSSPAVANGRIYFADTDNVYCVGSSREKPPVSPTTPDPINKPKPPVGPATFALVFPGDVSLKPGETYNVTLRLYDANGQFIGTKNADSWTLPTAPPPPPVPGSPPNNAPIPALQGSVSPEGKVIISPSVKAQSGVVQGKITVDGKEIVAKGRVRVYPVLPFEENFEEVDLDRIPTGWINLAGKFRTVKNTDGTRVMKKLANNPNPLLARAYGYLGTPEMSEYTISADIMCNAKEENKVINMPNMGVANCRYLLAIDGTKQKLNLGSWESRRRVESNMDFNCKPGVWYSFTFKVTQEGDKAICLGKVWQKGMPEPTDWTIKLEDPSPNRTGAPAIYAYATAIPTSGKGDGTEAFFDNVKVVPNKK